jgi:hypothetical protein
VTIKGKKTKLLRFIRGEGRLLGDGRRRNKSCWDFLQIKER